MEEAEADETLPDATATVSPEHVAAAAAVAVVAVVSASVNAGAPSSRDQMPEAVAVAETRRLACSCEMFVIDLCRLEIIAPRAALQHPVHELLLLHLLHLLYLLHLLHLHMYRYTCCCTCWMCCACDSNFAKSIKSLLRFPAGRFSA